MTYRLLLDYEAFHYLASLKKLEQQKIHKRLRQIQDYPAHWADYSERDTSGRLLQISVVDDYAIVYWEDFADKQVKVLEITRADN